MRTATPIRRWLPRFVVGGALAAVLAVVAVGSGIAAATAKPVNNTAPKIFGVARVGQVLSGDRGDWTNVNTYAYAWLRCNANGNGCNAIDGATGTQYQLTAADDGHRVRFRVTATNGDGATVATTPATAVVLASGKPANTAAPAISGTPQEGSTLTGSNGTWTNSPTKFTYAWLRCDNKGNSCATVNGATKNTYVIASGDVNTTIRFRVTASNSAGDETATSSPTPVIGKNRGSGCPAGGGNPDQVANLNQPARLLIDTFQSTPTVVVKGTQTLTVRFHITSTCGGPVQGALVYSTATPYSQWSIPPEASSGADGWATLTFTRLKGFPVSNKQQLIAMFVRARKGGENVLAGISNRRLISVRVNLRG
jgi:uncharacterized membrane protein